MGSQQRKLLAFFFWGADLQAQEHDQPIGFGA